MKRNWPIFVFFLLIFLLVIYLSIQNNKDQFNKPIRFANVSFLDQYYSEKENRKLVQEPNPEDPVIRQNLEIINKANAMEQKKKLLGANTICVFKANRFLPYTYPQFVATFTGLILPQQLIGGQTVHNSSIAQPLHISTPLPTGIKKVDFAKIKPVDADKAVFYGIAPKLFNKPRDQGACGSCWAYSAVACVEAQVVKKFLIENPAYVSTQYYIDWVKECKGCKGGFPLFVYQQVANDVRPYLGKESGVCEPPRQRFPYQLQGSIVYGNNGEAGYFPKDRLTEGLSYQNLELRVLSDPEIENLKKVLFNYGPISALIYIDDKLPFYSSGIYKTVDNKDGVKQNPNHAVVIGGYGINVYSERYWIIRNSWSTEYGEGGNIILSMDSPMCGFDIPIFDDIPPLVQ
jgi:hypothetical protein